MLASPLLVIAWLTVDAHLRRTRSLTETGAIMLVARRLPSNDLALAGGARWLRALSLEEPSAAFSDGPAMPDPDPAGGAVAPPVAVWAEATERASAGRFIVVKGLR